MAGKERARGTASREADRQIVSLKFNRRIRRTRSGEFELRLPPDERDVLRSLPGQMRDALALGDADPAVARLNPSACPDDGAGSCTSTTAGTA